MACTACTASVRSRTCWASRSNRSASTAGTERARVAGAGVGADGPERDRAAEAADLRVEVLLGGIFLFRKGILKREERDPEQGREIVAEHSFKNKGTSKVQSLVPTDGANLLVQKSVAAGGRRNRGRWAPPGTCKRKSRPEPVGWWLRQDPPTVKLVSDQQ